MIYLQKVQQRSWILPVQLTMKSFLNPYDNTTQFIVVFNNVWLSAPRRSCPHCIYFLSDAHPNNSVIPCGPTTQTAQTPASLTSCPPASPLEAVTASFPFLTPSILHLPLLHSFFLLNTIFPISLLHLLLPHPPLSADSHIWERLREHRCRLCGHLGLRCFIK